MRFSFMDGEAVVFEREVPVEDCFRAYEEYQRHAKGLGLSVYYTVLPAREVS